MSKFWNKPELIILIKGTRNEHVLGDCKTQYAVGPAQASTGCMNVTGTAACRGHSKT